MIKITGWGTASPANDIQVVLRGLLLWWSCTLAFFRSFFSFTFYAGFLEKLSPAQLRQDTFLLYPFVEAPQ
jgi:hypothetical protein